MKNFLVVAALCITLLVIAYIFLNPNGSRTIYLRDEHMVRLVQKKLEQNDIPVEINGNALIYPERYRERAEPLAQEAVTSVAEIAVENREIALEFIEKLGKLNMRPDSTIESNGETIIWVSMDNAESAKMVLQEIIRDRFSQQPKPNRQSDN